MSNRLRCPRAMLGSVLLLLSVGFLMAALLKRGGNGEAVFVTASAAVQDFEHLEFEGSRRSMARLKLDLVYVSKRRVPNGPDPIHNRSCQVFFTRSLLQLHELITLLHGCYMLFPQERREVRAASRQSIALWRAASAALHGGGTS